MPAKCRNHANGCPFQAADSTALNDHQDGGDCQYQLVPCPHPPCGEEIAVGELLTHLTGEHKARHLNQFRPGAVSIGYRPCLESKDRSLHPTIVEYERDFYVCSLIKRSGVYYAWAAALSRRRTLTKVTISLLGGSEGAEMTVTSEVFDVSTSHESILEGSRVLTFVEEEAERSVGAQTGRLILVFSLASPTAWTAAPIQSRPQEDFNWLLVRTRFSRRGWMKSWKFYLVPLQSGKDSRELRFKPVSGLDDGYAHHMTSLGITVQF